MNYEYFKVTKVKFTLYKRCKLVYFFKLNIIPRYF